MSAFVVVRWNFTSRLRRDDGTIEAVCEKLRISSVILVSVIGAGGAAAAVAVAAVAAVGVVVLGGNGLI